VVDAERGTGGAVLDWVAEGSGAVALSVVDAGEAIVEGLGDGLEFRGPR
jgi:hypothetical protein